MKNNRFTLSEDWTVVLLGILSIAIVMMGVHVQSGKIEWLSLGELTPQIVDISYFKTLGIQWLVSLVIYSIGFLAMGRSIRTIVPGFTVLFLLTNVAILLAGHQYAGSLNLEAVIFSLAIGLILNNFFELPLWLKSILHSELMVKIGLVILGSSVIFSDILKAGSLGVMQSVVVVVSVWYFAFWICKKLGLDRELSLMLSSAVSICGVSAAIATAGAIQGDNKKLSFIISLVLVTAIPMMIFMPMIAQYFGFPEAVTGAWLGGSIDTTGAVVASGTLVGEEALKVSTIVKFSQNVLLGLAALFISIYWSYKQNNTQEKPSLSTIWERFPKFIIGFIGVSLFFSFVVDDSVLKATKGELKAFQNLWFVLAFTSIGLETKFKDIFNADSKKPLIAFLVAQGFNIVVTLVLAYLLFS